MCVEGAEDVFPDVEGLDEGVEDLSLDGLWCVARWAIRFCDVRTRLRAQMLVVAL